MLNKTHTEMYEDIAESYPDDTECFDLPLTDKEGLAAGLYRDVH